MDFTVVIIIKGLREHHVTNRKQVSFIISERFTHSNPECGREIHYFSVHQNIFKFLRGRTTHPNPKVSLFTKLNLEIMFVVEL